MDPDLSKLKHHPSGAPGSPMARENGCKCAVMDNRYGLGMFTESDGTVIYAVNMSCPLHGEPEFFNEP